MSAKYWAVVDNASGLCESVEVASDEWVTAWRSANPDASVRYIEMDIDSPQYGGPGWVVDSETGWLMPPMPTDPGAWQFDNEPSVWRWVDLDAPTPEVLEGEDSEA